MPFKNIQRSEKLYVKIAEEINNSIIRGDFSPGEKLPPEREISVLLNASRASVREALAVLEILGVVDIRVGDGSYVKKGRSNFRLDINGLKESSPFELIEARYLIESAIVELAIDRATDEDIKVLEKTIQFLKDNVESDEKYHEYFDQGVQFHKELALITKNDVLIRISESLLQEEIHPLWRHLNKKVLLSKDARLHQIYEHEEILNAIKTKDKEKAKNAMTHHLKHLGELLLR